MLERDSILSVATVGLGGFGGATIDLLSKLDSVVRLAAVCEPDWAQHSDRVGALRSAGVMVLDNFADLLALPVEAVILPLPIDLHRPFTEQALAAVKHVLCEKPAAGCVADVDAMIAARDRAGRQCLIGYQYAYDPAVAQIKKQIAGGRLGDLIDGVLVASWPRGVDYFARNDWAGRWKRNGVWVRDSPANNALAHAAHLALMLADASDAGTAHAVAVEAELYRCNAIETFDTCSVRATLASGPPLLLLLTHAGAETIEARFTLRGTRGTLTFTLGSHATWSDDGERVSLADFDRSRAITIETFAEIVREGSSARHAVSLESAREQTGLIELLGTERDVVEVPASFADRRRESNGSERRFVPGLDKAMIRAEAEGLMLHELGTLPWTSAATRHG